MAMRVALKYCGGCDPAYDRVELFEKINRTAKNNIVWVSPDDPDRQATLLICGCQRACPEDEFGSGAGTICIKNDHAKPEEIVDILLKEGSA